MIHSTRIECVHPSKKTSSLVIFAKEGKYHQTNPSFQDVHEVAPLLLATEFQCYIPEHFVQAEEVEGRYYKERGLHRPGPPHKPEHLPHYEH